MIRRLQITRLFGIQGNTKQVVCDKNLTIIVGINGSGKTTILNMLHALLTCSFRALSRYDFECIELEADEGLLRVTRLPDSLEVEKRGRETNGDLGEPRRTEITMDTSSQQVRDNEFGDYSLGIEALYFPTYRRLETDFDDLLDDLWETDLPGYRGFRRDYYETMRRRQNAQMHGLSSSGKHSVGLPRTVVGFSKRDIERIVGNESERVERFERERLNKLIHDFVASLVTEPALRLGPELEGREKLYEELRESLTRTGLIACLGDNPDRVISGYVEIVAESRSQLVSLIAKEKPSSSELDQAQAYSVVMNVMSHGYVTKFLNMYRGVCSEIEENQAPFKELGRALEHFMNKPVRIENGRLVFSEDGRLGFEHLSAGEKQLVTLFVYTKLAVKPGGVVLIDEPELSLHVEWQRDLLTSLTSSKAPIQYLVATHSPMVISDYRDDVVPIGLYWDGEET
jgi:predicted ATPase